MSDIQGWFDVMKKMGEQTRKENEGYDRLFKSISPDSTYESFSFWKIEGGVLRIRKHPNGMYDRYSETFISDKEIDAMVKAKTCLD